MNTLEQILHRRSIRRFKAELPSREAIEKITEAGTYAPSGRGLQSGLILAITNKELRDRISAMNNVVWGGEEGFDPFYGAPAILVVLGKKESAHKVYDGSLIMGNMMLAADALGLGTCWIHRAREVFETEEGKQILRDIERPVGSVRRTLLPSRQVHISVFCVEERPRTGRREFSKQY